MQSKRPVLRFVAIFVLIIGLLNIALVLQGPRRPIVQKVLAANARAGAAVLRVFGEDANAQDREIRSPRYAILVSHGCDAVQPTILLIAAIVATPARILYRVLGIAVGTCVLMLLNLARIVSLFFIGATFPRGFDTFHVDVWGSVFIVLTVVVWIVWARLALNRSPQSKQHAQP